MRPGLQALHHDIIDVVILVSCRLSANGLHDNALDLCIRLEACGVIAELEALVVHVDDARREVLRIPRVLLDLLYCEAAGRVSNQNF